VDKGDDLHGLDARIHIGPVPAGALTLSNGLGDEVDRAAIPAEETFTQRGLRVEVLNQEDDERPDQIGRPPEAFDDPADLLGDVTVGVAVNVVVQVAGVEHRVQQLILGVEVMEQTGGADPGVPGDLPE
jgi:hypothetical protein